MHTASQNMSSRLTALQAGDSADVTYDMGLLRIKQMVAIAASGLCTLALVGLFSLKGMGAKNSQPSSDSPSNNPNTSVNSGGSINTEVPTAPNPPQQSSSAGSSTNVQITGGQTHVEVNGESIDVPANGSVNKTVQSSDGSQSVNVNIQNNTNGTSSGSSSYHSTNISTFNSVNAGGSNISSQFNSNSQ